MSALSEDVLTAIEQTMPITVATACPEGIPNIIYMSFLKAVDADTLVAADCAFDKTRTNLEANPRMAVLVMNPETKRAFQIKCTAEEVTSGQRFDAVRDWVHLSQPQFKVRAAYYLKVESVYSGADKLA